MDPPASPRKCRFSPVLVGLLMTQNAGVGKALQRGFAAIRLLIGPLKA